MALSDLVPVDGGKGWEAGKATIKAKVYERSVISDTCHSVTDDFAAYNLGAKYTKFKTTVGNDENEAPTDANLRFEVTVVGNDGPPRKLDVKFGEAKEFDVNVAGVTRLTLRVDHLACSTAARLRSGAMRHCSETAAGSAYLD